MATRTLLTAAEYARYNNGENDRTELVEGRIEVSPRPETRHGLVASNLYDVLSPYVRAHRLGRCFTDGTGYHLPIPDNPRDTIRGPDVSFVRAERLPEDGVGRGWLYLAPDLVAEVRSPSERRAKFAKKVAHYLAAGTQLFWEVNADRRTVTVHEPNVPARRLREEDTLDGGDVVPGFAMPVADLFEGLARDG